MNPYEILGVKKDASDKEIKKAYREKAKKWHPDVSNGDKDLEDKFKEASLAYEVLSDKTKKEQYDRFGTIGNQHNQQAHHYNDLSDLFNSQFMDFNQRRRSINIDVNSRLRITLADSIFGCDKIKTIVKVVACDSCKASGKLEGSGVNCSACGGQGKSTTIHGNMHFVTTCGVCIGTGKIFEKCPKCKGECYSQNSEKVKIRIPKNLRQRAGMRLEGKGNTTYRQNGSKYTGSHYLMVDFPSYDKGVTKKGDDLFININVTIDQILAEDKITIRLFNRKNITLKLKSNHNNDELYTIDTDFLNGNIYVKVLLQLPSKDINEEEKESLVKALREVYGEPKSVIPPAINATCSNNGS